MENTYTSGKTVGKNINNKYRMKTWKRKWQYI